MAHIGCHVPATHATIPVLQRVFTRISGSDSLESNGAALLSTQCTLSASTQCTPAISGRCTVH